MPVTILPITDAAFAPYGALVRPAEGKAMTVVEAAFAHLPDAATPALEWVRLKDAITLPLTVERVERHPFSAQTFLPQGDSPLLVVVCDSGADGMPDPATTRAFALPADTGVTFHAGAWHRSLAPRNPNSAYVMAMMRTGRNDDTEIVTLSTPVVVGA